MGFEADKDLAVLRIKPKNVNDLVPIAIGTSHNLLVGQNVFAIGNPFGMLHLHTSCECLNVINVLALVIDLVLSLRNLFFNDNNSSMITWLWCS